VEVSAYCRDGWTGRGVGAALYEALFDSLRGLDLRRAFAGIALPNPASVALHRRFGFGDIGVFHEAGRKFDRYWDVLWMERGLVLA
jgi:phosphinothricin acetyltransferase